MIKTYKFKLYRSHRNVKLHWQINEAGLAYNHCVCLHKMYYRLFHKHLNMMRLQKHLTKQKKIKGFEYLTEFGSQALQDVTQRIENGYKKFFKKENKHPPKPRKIRKTKSFTLKQAGWSLDESTHTIKINGQNYRYHKSREIEGIIKTVTVKRDSLGDIYIFLACEVKQNEVIPRLGKSIGFDFGLKGAFLVAPTSQDDVEMPRFFNKNRNRLKKIQHRLSRKLKANTDHYVKRGKGFAPVYKRSLWECSNIQRGFADVRRFHKKIKNQRENYHWELAYKLCGEYAFIAVETLSMHWMFKHHGKKVGDYGFGKFLQILEYVAKRCGTTLVKVDKWYPSSQLCHNCGFKNKAVKDVSIREWDCPNCGEHHNRDRNAAINILKEGFRQFEANETQQ